MAAAEPHSESTRTVQVNLNDLGPLLRPDDRPFLLTLLDGDQAGSFVELPEGRDVLVGRGSGADFRIDNAEVSGKHAIFRRKGGEVLVDDLGSTNGTWFESRRLLRTFRLGAGAEVSLGTCRVRVIRSTTAELKERNEIDRDLGRAENYVRSILPPAMRWHDLRLDWAFRPAVKIGGDAFGYGPIDEHRLAIYLIDVSGHGLTSALHSVSVVNQLRQRSLPGVDFGDPAAVLDRLNEAYPMEAHDGIYFTIWYGVHDRRDRSLVYASGGHPPALLRRAEGAVERLKTPGMAIGFMPELRARTARIELPVGGRLYLFSDGVFEIADQDDRMGDLDDLERRVAAAPPPQAAELLAEALAGARNGLLDDDFSLVVMEFDPDDEDVRP